jgi:hypothetical protein
MLRTHHRLGVQEGLQIYCSSRKDSFSVEKMPNIPGIPEVRTSMCLKGDPLGGLLQEPTTIKAIKNSASWWDFGEIFAGYLLHSS